MNYFGLGIGDKQVRAYFFNISSYTSEHFVNVLATIANATHAKFGDLPTVLFLDLGNRNFKLMANSRYQRFSAIATSN
jgi:hypothetical protein